MEILDRSELVDIPIQGQPLMLPNVFVVSFVSAFSLVVDIFFMLLPCFLLTPHIGSRPTLLPAASTRSGHLSPRKKVPTWSGACKTVSLRRPSG